MAQISNKKFFKVASSRLFYHKISISSTKYSFIFVVFSKKE